MKKYFYSHLLPIEKLTIELEELDISANEKTHLVQIMEATFHYTILEVVLDDLISHDKKTFLAHLLHDDHDTTWKFLKNHMMDSETKIMKAVEKASKGFLADIKKTKKKKKR